MAVTIANDLITFYNGAVDNADALFALISRYDNRFTHTTGTDTITVDNAFKLKFTNGSYNHLVFNVTDLEDNILLTREQYVGGTNASGAYIAIVIAAPNFFYARFGQQVVQDQNKNGYFFWYKKDNKNYFGIAPNVVAIANRYIENTTIINVENHDTTYKFMTPTNNVLISPKILFSDIQTIYNNNGDFIVLDDFKSCSQVLYDSTITVNGKNYYAIGRNTLIEVEE